MKEQNNKDKKQDIKESGIVKSEANKKNAKGNEIPSGKEKIAVIRIRGKINIYKKIGDTFNMLRLDKKNWCVILDKNPVNLGMIKVIKDYVAYGEIDKETLDILMKKAKKDKKGRLKPFRLNPPKKGFERKGIKVSFRSGGALGYRGDKINLLIKKML